MEMPKLNQRKHQSNIHQMSLEIEIYKAIEKYEKDNNYQFESFELDNVLLTMIKRSHEEYLKYKFGKEIE